MEKKEQIQEAPCFGRCVQRPENKIFKQAFRTRADSAKCCLITGIITLLFVAVILPSIIYSIADEEINTGVVIDSFDAPSYNAWQNNVEGDGAKTEITYKIYFFDIQNKDDVTYNASLPVVTEVGPYAFREYYKKFDIEWLDGGKAVQYQTQKYHIFDQDLSLPGLTLDDELMLPYLPAIGFEYLLAAIPPGVQDQVAEAEKNMTTAKLDDLRLQIQTEYNNNPVRRNFLMGKVDDLEVALEDYGNQSTPASQLFKSLMCKLPAYASNGEGNTSPFWPIKPIPAYFGYLNDPLMMEVQNLLAFANLSEEVPWSAAIPGATTNWTSEEDTRRRISPSVLKTGKGNVKEVSSYVRYNNMSDQYVCLSPMDSQNVSEYREGEEFPACALFQYEWNESTAESMGYVHAFQSEYANRIAGTDANMFGRPVTAEKLLVYISDIYRTAYMEHTKTVYDWHKVKLRRYQLQMKDLQNASTNPFEAQYYQFGPAGVENVSAVAGLPSFVSLPHFLHGQSTLIAGCKGISPKEEVHDTYVDIEPQTGLLVRARKRLQVNYYVASYPLPVVDSDTANEFNSVCLNETRADGIDCKGLNNMVLCLATPSWNLKDGGVYFPYAWVEEGMTLSADDAADLKDSLYWIDDFADEVQQWALVSAGILFAMLMGMLAQSWLMQQEDQEDEHSKLSTTFKAALLGDNANGEQQQNDAVYNKVAAHGSGHGAAAAADYEYDTPEGQYRPPLVGNRQG